MLVRQYLRIKRAVQAAFNTESSYLSAKLAQMQKGGQAAREAVQGGDDVDPMAALDRATGGGTAVRGFVAASNGEMVGGQAGAARQDEPAQENADEIAVDDDDDD